MSQEAAQYGSSEDSDIEIHSVTSLASNELGYLNNNNNNSTDFDIKNLGMFYPYTAKDLSSINVLPSEILTLIFSLFKEKSDLVSLLPVSKYWASLLIEIIWFRPKLQSEKAFIGIQKILDLDPATTFYNYRKYIRRLNLCFIANYVTDDFLIKFENCPNLERLTLVNCVNLTGPVIGKVLHNCSKLQSIDLSGAKNITDDIFISLAENCPRLQGVYAPDANSVSNEAIKQLFMCCPFLKRVKLTKNEFINDTALNELTKNYRYIVEIDLHGCPNVTDESLKIVFSKLEQLREFRISQNRNITDNIFKSLPDTQSLMRLRIMDFTDCYFITDRSIQKLVKCAPRLRNIVLSKCINITDASLKALSKLNKSLHYLHLGHCAGITDYGVKILIDQCYKLQYIDLACCSQLTNASVIELANLPRLKRIGLVKCNNITDEGILQLVHKRGPGDTLERVHLSYCTNLTAHPIYLLLQCCPKLTHLSLTGISPFLRPDIRQYCRPPPDEFTPHQKSLFCVFSGNGVKKLRDHLTKLFTADELANSNNGNENNDFSIHLPLRNLPNNLRVLNPGLLPDLNSSFNGTGVTNPLNARNTGVVSGTSSTTTGIGISSTNNSNNNATGGNIIAGSTSNIGVLDRSTNNLRFRFLGDRDSAVAFQDLNAQFLQRRLDGGNDSVEQNSFGQLPVGRGLPSSFFTTGISNQGENGSNVRQEQQQGDSLLQQGFGSAGFTSNPFRFQGGGIGVGNSRSTTNTPVSPEVHSNQWGEFQNIAEMEAVVRSMDRDIARRRAELGIDNATFQQILNAVDDESQRAVPTDVTDEDQEMTLEND